MKLSVVDVAPETLLNVAPPSVETCHCTVGVGLPEAAAVKLAVEPALTVTFTGLVVITGPAVTVRVAAVVVALPTVLVKTARYSLPVWPTAAVKLSVVAVAPAMLLNVAPPSVDTCHCTVGAGLPEAAAVKDGYETLVVRQPFPTPWYEYMPLDFLSENFWPMKIHDERVVDYNLVPQQMAPTSQL